MAIETGTTGKDVPPDTSKNAQPWHYGDYGDRADLVIVPGVGVCLSKHRISDFEKAAREAYTAKHPGVSWPEDNKLYHKMVIPEDVVLAWAQAIKKQQQMDRDYAKSVHAHEATCHPGTDTQDPTKDPQPWSKTRDDFSLDRSESTIRIGVCSSNGTWLNGSTVKHSRYVSIEFTTPDGRNYGRINMTFDQFASMLVSNMSTQCTWNDYWGVDEECVMLTEVVKPPQSISERMQSRLENRLDDIEKRFAELSATLENRIDSGKAMPKTQLAEMLREVGLLREALASNRDFTVEQAQEEVASIVEQAAIAVAHTLRIAATEVQAAIPLLSHKDATGE